MKVNLLCLSVNSNISLVVKKLSWQTVADNNTRLFRNCLCHFVLFEWNFFSTTRNVEACFLTLGELCFEEFSISLEQKEKMLFKNEFEASNGVLYSRTEENLLFCWGNVKNFRCYCDSVSISDWFWGYSVSEIRSMSFHAIVHLAALMWTQLMIICNILQNFSYRSFHNYNRLEYLALAFKWSKALKNLTHKLKIYKRFVALLSLAISDLFLSYILNNAFASFSLNFSGVKLSDLTLRNFQSKIYNYWFCHHTSCFK